MVWSRMRYPDFPVPFGVFRAAEESCYGERQRGAEDSIKGAKGPADWDELIHSGETWAME